MGRLTAGRIVLMLMAVIAAIMAACSTDGCLNNQNSLPLAGFYSSTTHSAISIDSIDISGVGAPHDSLLHSSGTTVSEIYLPFRSNENSTSFCFHYTERHISSPALNDTLTFRYTSEPYFASEECGAMYRFRINHFDYTRHLIDSVAVADSLITNTDIQRIHIYMRTQPSSPTE